MKDTGPAAAPSPRVSRRGTTSGAIAEAPYAAEKNPDRVTPIWTVERNRLGLRARAAVRAPVSPDFSMRRTWLSRRDTRAISAAANTPPSSTKPRTNAILSRAPLSMTRLYRSADRLARAGAASGAGRTRADPKSLHAAVH